MADIKDVNTNAIVNIDAAEKLSEGMLESYEPELKSVQGQLIELTKKQEVVYRQLHEENLKLAGAQYSSEINDIFVKIKTYREKLLTAKKKMTSIHERAAKAKKRALKMEQNMQKEAKQRVQQREREEQLIGQAQRHEDDGHGSS